MSMGGRLPSSPPLPTMGTRNMSFSLLCKSSKQSTAYANNPKNDFCNLKPY